jgi:hypothetical protein
LGGRGTGHGKTAKRQQYRTASQVMQRESRLDQHMSPKVVSGQMGSPGCLE